MSKQGFEDFQKKIGASADVKKQVDAAYQQLAESLSKAHSAYYESVAALGKQNGCEFTAAEVSEKFSTGVEELDDAQLEAVAGGLTYVQSSLSTSSLSTSYALPAKLPGTFAAT